MNKEEQKKLLTEIMNDDAKDGLYEKDISKMETTQTAVEWLIEQVHSDEYQKAFGQTYVSISLIEQAKAIEKEQIIRFAISCHQQILRDRKAPENLISENLLLFEQYYNETYNK